MFIKELELKNFQKHTYFKAIFTPNVNVIFGASGSGKSCIIRSIRWLFFPNELRGDVVRKEGTKKTSVKGILDNGVIIERVKTATLNRYKITIGKETKEYDAIGKGLPEEVLNVLKVRPIEIDKDNLILNVANQLSLPFLFDKSPTFRVKLFNKLTGNDIIDNVFQSLNKDILQIGREEKLENEHLIELNENKEQVTKDINNAQKDYNKFSKIYEKVKSKIETYNRLIKCQDKLIKVDIEEGDVNLKLKSIKLIPDKNLIQLEKRIDKFDKLNQLVSHLKEIKNELINVDKELAKILLPKINLKDLKNKIETLERLVELQDLVKNNKDKQSKTIIELNKIIEEIKIKNKEYKELLGRIKICPVCQTKLSEEAIEEIRL